LWRARIALKIITLILAGVTASSCAQSARSPSEVRPGERDYPERNPHPKHQFLLTAVVPPSLSMRFTAVYRASATAGDTQSSGTSCQREVGFAVMAPLHLPEPIRLSPSGDRRSSATIVLDQYLPGRCDWMFSTIGYFIENLQPTGAPVIVYNEQSTDTDYHLDVWCVRVPNSPPQYPESCSSLKDLFESFPALIPKQLFDSTPLVARDNAGPVEVGPSARAVVIELHDIDVNGGSKFGRPQP
jgi:hypothetical protein